MSLRYAAWFWLALGLGYSPATAGTPDLSRLEVPPGFRIRLVTDQVPNARQMAISASGVLFVGSRKEGKVYAVLDNDGADPAEAVLTVASGLTMPSGIACKGDDLYVGAVDRVLRFPGLGATPHAHIKPEIVTDSLPDKRYHGWKYLSFGPDGYLYLAVGAPCNICQSEDPRFTSMLALDINSGRSHIVATGIRNSVGQAWHPDTGQLWFSDNGRDMLGDDVPPDEINRIENPGEHFGYPYIHAGNIPDPQFGRDRSASEFVSPVIRVQAHSAVLGMAFYHAHSFPRRYHNALFVAEHGSWNRTKKVGYEVSVALFDPENLQQPSSYKPFVSGWLKDEKAWGRPNDVMVSGDGSLLISDDKAGAIYRVFYDSPPEHAVP